VCVCHRRTHYNTSSTLRLSLSSRSEQNPPSADDAAVVVVPTSIRSLQLVACGPDYLALCDFDMRRLRRTLTYLLTYLLMMAAISPLGSSVITSKIGKYCYKSVAVWRSYNGIWRISEVTIRRARLVLGWMTIFGETNQLHG